MNGLSTSLRRTRQKPNASPQTSSPFAVRTPGAKMNNFVLFDFLFCLSGIDRYCDERVSTLRTA